MWCKCVCVAVLVASVRASNGPLTLAPLAAQTTYQDPRELCEAEMFNPLCTDSEVVVVTEARYGRMQLGRCVRTDYGYVGCFSDVLEHLDGMCSGRRTCALRIPDSTLDTTTVCPREFKTYLNISYECTQVESQACQLCTREGAAKVTAPSGFIGSIVTAETQSTLSCGSSKCPWQIEVQSGQTINITLYDFAMEQRASSGGVAPPSSYISPESCFRYAVIKEAPNHKTVPVCGGKGRIQSIYSSVTNTVEINIVSPEVFSQKGQFMLYYEAVGCSDFEVAPGAVLKRYGDVVTVTCDDPSHTWQRKCVGTQWVGEMGTCPGMRGASQISPATNTLPIGVLIAIVLGIALVIGVLIVTVGVVCLKRQRSDYARTYQPTYYVHAGSGAQCYELREDLQQQQLLPIDAAYPGPQQPKFCGTLPPPKPPQPGAQQAPRAGSARGGLGGRENLYGAGVPRMEQRPLPSLPNIPEATASGDDPHCPCHVAGRPPALHQQLSQPGPGAVRSPSRAPTECPQSAPVMAGTHITLLPCSVGPPSQHYTVLDPSEVQQLLQSGAMVNSAPLSSGSDPLAYGSSFQYLSSDDVTSCDSPTTAGPPQDIQGSSSAPSAGAPSAGAPSAGAPSAGSSCHEIPLRPTRECSQPRIDTTSVAGSGSSVNSSWP